MVSVGMGPPMSCLIDTIGTKVEIAFAEKRPILVFIIFNLHFFDDALEVGDNGVVSLGKLFRVVGIVLSQFFQGHNRDHAGIRAKLTQHLLRRQVYYVRADAIRAAARNIGFDFKLFQIFSVIAKLPIVLILDDIAGGR